MESVLEECSEECQQRVHGVEDGTLMRDKFLSYPIRNTSKLKKRDIRSNSVTFKCHRIEA